MNVQRVIAYAILALVIVGVVYRCRLYAAGIRVTSWWRTPWKNDEVGGVVLSKHQAGLAFDVTPVTASTLSALRRIGFARIINETNHYHVEVI